MSIATASFYTKQLIMKKYFAFLPLIASCNGLGKSDNNIISRLFQDMKKKLIY